MKSDISRQTFNARKHYNRVVMQQGRVQLDADWNEQQDITEHHIETRTSDMLGQGCVSADNNGFAVTFTPDGSDLIISPGHIYVDGVLCELEQETAVAVNTIKSGKIQVNLSEVEEQAFRQGGWIELLDEKVQRLSLLKIADVQEDIDKQIVTLTLDQSGDPVPDGNPKLWKVRPVTTYLTQPNYPQLDGQPSGFASPHTRHIFLVYLDVWSRQITPFDDPAIREVALGGADTTQRCQTIWQVKIERVEIQSKELLDAIKLDTGNLPKEEQSKLESWLSRWLRVFSFSPPLSEWKGPEPSTGKLRVHTTAISSSDTPGYRGLENQLYHIEIHQGTKDSQMPIFKWARNNASSLVAAKVENGVVMVQGSGQAGLLGLAVGNYVELLDEQRELLGEAGSLAQIKQIDDITGQLTLEPPPASNSQNTQLRLWNGIGTFTANQDSAWLPLEGGIEVQFTSGTYKTGDYWMIPARTVTGNIEWPYRTPQPPSGIQHHYTRLSTLLHTQSIWLHQDCRRHFFPSATEALHILDINWTNDVLNPRKLLKEGLSIMLDGEPDQGCAGAMQAAMIVSVETALPGGGAGIFLINGHFEIINGHVIKWHWYRGEKEGLFAKFFGKFDEFLGELFSTYGHYWRVRVTLKGHYIWRTVNGRRIYLDGQTFGMPGKVASGHIPTTQREVGTHIDLQFPSGAGRVASDFESWFYIKE